MMNMKLLAVLTTPYIYQIPVVDQRSQKSRLGLSFIPPGNTLRHLGVVLRYEAVVPTFDRTGTTPLTH